MRNDGAEKIKKRRLKTGAMKGRIERRIHMIEFGAPVAVPVPYSV